MDSKPCTWDAESRCWRTAAGAEHVVDREARRAEFFAQRKEDEAKADAWLLARAEQIDEEAMRLEMRGPASPCRIVLLKPLPPCPALTHMVGSYYHNYRAVKEALAKQPEADALGCLELLGDREDSDGNVRLWRSDLYWEHVERLLAALEAPPWTFCARLTRETYEEKLRISLFAKLCTVVDRMEAEAEAALKAREAAAAVKAARLAAERMREQDRMQREIEESERERRRKRMLELQGGELARASAPGSVAVAVRVRAVRERNPHWSYLRSSCGYAEHAMPASIPEYITAVSFSGEIFKVGAQPEPDPTILGLPDSRPCRPPFPLCPCDYCHPKKARGRWVSRKRKACVRDASGRYAPPPVKVRLELWLKGFGIHVSGKYGQVAAELVVTRRDES